MARRSRQRRPSYGSGGARHSGGLAAADTAPIPKFFRWSGESCEAAYPIQIDGRLYGALVLEIAPRPREQLEAVLQQLSWGSVWFELRVHRQKASDDGARTARLQTVLDLIATALEHERFEAAATALVTDLAVRFGCERVTLGSFDGKRTRLSRYFTQSSL